MYTINRGLISLTICLAGLCFKHSTISDDDNVEHPSACASFTALARASSVWVHGHRVEPLIDIPRWNKPRINTNYY